MPFTLRYNLLDNAFLNHGEARCHYPRTYQPRQNWHWLLVHLGALALQLPKA